MKLAECFISVDIVQRKIKINKDKAAFIIVKSNCSTTQPAVVQDSNDKPNKLSRRTATRSHTRLVCKMGITVLPATHTQNSVCTPQSQGNCPLTGSKLYCLVTVTECLTSDIFSMLLCGVSDCIYCI